MIHLKFIETLDEIGLDHKQDQIVHWQKKFGANVAAPNYHACVFLSSLSIQ